MDARVKPGHDMRRNVPERAENDTMTKDFGIRDGEVAVDLPASTGRRRSISSAASTRPGRSARTARRTPANPTRSARSSSIRAGREALKDVETCTPSRRCSTGWTGRRAICAAGAGHYGVQRGTFALRSPARPNPIAMSVVKLLRVDGNRLRWSASTASTARRCSTSSRISPRPIACRTRSSAGTSDEGLSGLHARPGLCQDPRLAAKT